MIIAQIKIRHADEPSLDRTEYVQSDQSLPAPLDLFRAIVFTPNFDRLKLVMDLRSYEVTTIEVPDPEEEDQSA